MSIWTLPVSLNHSSIFWSCKAHITFSLKLISLASWQLAKLGSYRRVGSNTAVGSRGRLLAWHKTNINLKKAKQNIQIYHDMTRSAIISKILLLVCQRSFCFTGAANIMLHCMALKGRCLTVGSGVLSYSIQYFKAHDEMFLSRP